MPCILSRDMSSSNGSNVSKMDPAGSIFYFLRFLQVICVYMISSCLSGVDSGASYDISNLADVSRVLSRRALPVMHLKVFILYQGLVLLFFSAVFYACDVAVQFSHQRFGGSPLA